MTNGNAPINPIDPKGVIAIGLTKREYFAAIAMQGIAALGNSSTSFEQDAEAAVKHADTLINALNKPNA